MSQTDSTKTETETEQEKETQKLAIKSSFLFDFETEIKSISLKRDELKDFLLLTQNQLEVNDKKRETRIKEKEKQFPKSLFNFHQECEKVFLNDWKIFKFKNRIYQDQHEIKQEIETPEAQKFEIDYEESQTQDNFTKLMNYSFESEKDEQKEDLSNEVIEDEDLNFSLLKIPNRDKALIANKTEREKNMKNLFNVYSQKDITQYIGDPRIPFKPFINSPEYQIFVEFVDLSLNFKEQLEPFYFSLALFDLRRKTRISENFYFQFNEEKFSFLPSNQKDSGISLVTQSKRAVFNISEPSKDIFLLLTISTIFQGDHEAKADIYSKPVPTKQKLYDKLKSQITDSCKKFSQFKQDFTWAMFPLFSFDRRTKQLCETFLSNKIQQFSPLYRIKDFTSEEQFFKFLGEQKATMKKQSSIPGFCSFKIARINEQNRKELFGNSTIFDPSMRVVEDNQDTKTAVLEMEDFALSAKRAVNYCFVNNLYIYPKFLTISSIKGSSIQNIEIKIQLKEDDKDIQSPGLPVFYGRILEKKFVDFRYVNIQYKTRKPHFNDEIKIALPLNLTHKHHLLFTFYNLNHKDKKQQGKELFGHAVVPIFQPDFLIEGKFQVPVCMALSSSGYLSSSELVMQEKQKNYFELESKIISSVYPQDKDVMGFLKSIEMLSRNGKEDLVQSMQVLRKHSANFHDILIQFLPVLFNVLLDIMTNKQQDDPLLREEAFHTFAQLSFEVIQIREALEVDVLQNYVDYVFNNFDNGKREIFQELVGQWNKALEHDLSQVSDPQNIQSEGNAFVNPTRFFFDLIIKSMVLYLDFNGKLNSNQRLDLFGIDFLDGMRNLVRNLNKEVVVRFIKGLNVAKRLNQAIALFLKDLIDICDVSFVFEIVESYIEALQTQDVNIQILSYEFINLFVEHENYVQFNIPVMPTYTSSTNLVEFLSQRHLLSGIIIQSVFKTLEMKDVNNKIRSIAITTLQNLLHKHDIDPRFQTPQIKSRIAIIYHLFVLFMIDKMDVYKDFPRELRRDLLISFLYILKMIDKHYFIQWWCFEGISRRIDFFQLLELCIDSFDYLGKKKLEEIEKNKEETARHNTNNLEMLKHIEQSYDTSNLMSRKKRDYPTLRLGNKRGLKESPKQYDRGMENAGGFSPGPTNITELAIQQLQFQGKSGTVRNLDSQDDAKNNPKNIDLTENRDTRQKAKNEKSEVENLNSVQTPKNQFEKILDLNKSSTITSTTSINRPTSLQNPTFEGNLSTQVNLIILDILENIVQATWKDLQKEQCEKETSILGMIFHTVIAMYQHNQSETLLRNLFNTTITMIMIFEKVIFKQNIKFLSELCTELLVKTVYHNPEVRRAANVMLYLIFKRNYRVCGDFSRSKIHTIIAFSRLVGDPTTFKAEKYVRKTLRILDVYAEKEDAKMAKFVGMMKEHSQEMAKILHDSIKLKKYGHDPEMTSDLYHRIADGYREAPDLRLAWLESLHKFNCEKGNTTEAAYDQIHIAALVAEYLHLTDPRSDFLPQGAKGLVNISPTCAEEAYKSKKLDFTRLSQSPSFTQNGFLLLLQRLVNALKKEKLFELQIQAYKILIPIYEHLQDYPALSRSHLELKSAYDELIKENMFNAGERAFGMFFRVGFYGKRFGELDSKEFIYRESGLTHLFTLTERLKSQFVALFGEQNVVIIQSSSSVDVTKLELAKVYIQITAVKPYFEEEEDKQRVSEFQRSFNVSQFHFQTPFTKSGKSQGPISEQWMKKTILFCKGQFPYVVKRLPVVKKIEQDFSPIQVSTENLKEKNIQLERILNSRIKDIKNLQSILSGTCLTSVNVGPFEICKVFLSEPQNFDTQNIKDLRSEFHKFLLLLQQGINVNERYAKDAQKEFQEAVKIGYAKLKEHIEPYLSEDGVSKEILELHKLNTNLTLDMDFSNN